MSDVGEDRDVLRARQRIERIDADFVEHVDLSAQHVSPRRADVGIRVDDDAIDGRAAEVVVGVRAHLVRRARARPPCTAPCPRRVNRASAIGASSASSRNGEGRRKPISISAVARSADVDRRRRTLDPGTWEVPRSSAFATARRVHRRAVVKLDARSQSNRSSRGHRRRVVQPSAKPGTGPSVLADSARALQSRESDEAAGFRSTHLRSPTSGKPIRSVASLRGLVDRPGARAPGRSHEQEEADSGR